MSTGETNYSETIERAYDAVKSADMDDSFKLAGFKIILTNELAGSVVAPKVAGGSVQIESPDSAVDVLPWQSKIAKVLNITEDQVLEIYHMNSDGQIELVIERNLIPDALVTATKDIAKLLAAGRQAADTEDKTLVSDIRTVVEGQYKVVDKKNFSTSITNLGAKFRLSGEGKERSIELINGAFKLVGEVAQKYVDGSK